MTASLLIAALNAAHPAPVVSKVLDAYAEAKRNLYLGNLRPNEVEGGRFAEGVLRLLEHRTTGSFTPLNRQINTNAVIVALEQLPAASQPDSVRIHIPRTLRVIYDIRNKRDAAHLSDGIDANVQDATLVMACCDWILAELARLYLAATPASAHALIEELVERKAPTVQAFGTFLKTLNPALGPSDRILVLLYVRGTKGATREELTLWLKPAQRASVPVTLSRLEHSKDFAHRAGEKYFITRAGQLDAESRKLLTS